MESPVALLKSAAYEADSHSRTDKVIKACKIITDILPYDKKSQVLIEESELMKYLMITLPLNPKAIDLIIHTMLDKFKKVHYFLKETWLGFLHVAQLEEGDAEKKRENPLKLFQLGVRNLIKSSILKDLDSHIQQPTRGQTYNDQIQKSKEFIKINTLGYAEKILIIYLSELRSSIPFKPDIPDLIMKFLANTNTESVIVKTCSLIEKIKDIDPEFIFGEEVEEMVTTKKDSQINLRSESSVSNLEDIEKLRASQRKSKIGDGKSPSASITSGKFKKNHSKKASILSHVEESKSSEDESITEEEEEDEDNSPIRINNYAEGANNKIEDWLSDFKNNDIPLLNRTPFVEEFIKDDLNCEMLLSFIYDPRFHRTSDCWRQKYPVFISQDESNFGGVNEGLGYNKLREHKDLYSYVLRSYKTMQLLSEDRNYRFITETDYPLIQRFFNGLYTSLTNKEDVACNLNHVLVVIESFLLREPEKSIKFILQFNLPYKFLINIDFPYVQRFFMAIFNCLPNAKELDSETYKKVLEYCRLTSLFIDISQVILSGSSTFPNEKIKADYKPEGMTDVIQFVPEEHHEQGQENELKVCSLERADAKENKKDSITNALLEEFKGFELDIDCIKGLLQPIKKPNKKDLVKKNENKKKTDSKTMKRYPSLLQKSFYDDQQQKIGETSPKSGFENALPTEHFIDISPNSSKQALNQTPEVRSPAHSDSNRSAEPKKSSPQKNTSSKTTLPTINKQHTTTTQSPLKQSSPVKKEGILKQSSPSKPTSIQKITPQPVTQDPIIQTNPKLPPIKKATAESPGLPSQVRLRDTPISSTTGSKIQIGSNRNIEKTENTGPERKTYIKEFDMEVIGKKELEQLRELYPTSTKNIEPTPLDREAKKPEYKVKNIKASDQLPVALCELLDVLFQRMLSNGISLDTEITQKINVQAKDEELKKKYSLNRTIGSSQVDYSQFWRIIFGDKAKVFANLLTNYLIKIKIQHFNDINSGYISGVIVNRILEQCKQNNYLKRFTDVIQATCRENFSFFCKTLIQSYAWVGRPDLKVYLQDYEVQQPLGSGRILLTKTLYLMIKNDEENEYSILNEINDTCWHTLVMWFFTKKTNSIYQEIFFSICQVAFLHSNEKIVLNILFKLNLIFNLYKTWTEIYQNNVLLKDNHVESIYSYIKKFTKLIAQTAETQESFSIMREQLSTNASWNSLKAAFLLKPKEKKRTGTEKSKLKPKAALGGLLSPSRNDTGHQSRRGTENNFQMTMSSLRTHSPNTRTPRDSPPGSPKNKKV